MDYHQNARLTIHSREQLARRVLDRGCTLKQAAACFRVSAKTAGKWVRRFHQQGLTGLRDRSSRPHRLHRPTSAELAEQVEQLRRQRWTGLRIAQQTGLSRATVSRILRRLKTAGPPLRAHPPGRSAPSGHQEAGPHRPAFAPGHRRPPRLGLRHRLGVRAGGRRRPLPHRLLRHLSG